MAAPLLAAAAVLGLALLLTSSDVRARATSSNPNAGLTGTVLAGFDDEDRQSVTDGKSIARLLAATGREDVTVAGIIRINVSAERLIAQYRDIVRFESGPSVSGVGLFSSPAVLADIESLVVPPEDLADLAGCKEGDCKINLSHAAIRRFKQEVRWTAPDAARQATRVMHDVVVQYTRVYQQRGRDALVTYGHREDAVSLKARSADLLRQARTWLPGLGPVASYFERYPDEPLPSEAEEFFYWSRMSFGMKPVIRANHVVIAPISISTVRAHVIISQAIYSSHYMPDGLEVRCLLPVDASGERLYFISLNLAHIEALSGFRGRLLGPIIRRNIRNSTVRHLQFVKAKVEAAS